MVAVQRHHNKYSASKLTNKTGEAGDEVGVATKRKAHPGFKAVQGKIQAEGYSRKVAEAILAARTRHASTSAKRANLHLSKVKD